jgi:hypothetical protein
MMMAVATTRAPKTTVPHSPTERLEEVINMLPRS